MKVEIEVTDGMVKEALGRVTRKAIAAYVESSGFLQSVHNSVRIICNQALNEQIHEVLKTMPDLVAAVQTEVQSQLKRKVSIALRAVAKEAM